MINFMLGILVGGFFGILIMSLAIASKKTNEREVSWWFHVDGEHENLWRCKKCGRGVEIIARKHRYCPHCGANMMGVE